MGVRRHVPRSGSPVASWSFCVRGIELPATSARRSGEEFTTRLETIWRANGIATKRRLGALDDHRERCSRDEAPSGPGSYSWPRLRVEAEVRFARGEDPSSVICELRGRHRSDVATVPSVRTMRRWHHQRRWLVTSTEHDPVRADSSHQSSQVPSPKRRWRKLPRIEVFGPYSEERALGALASFVFEDRPPYDERAGLGRNSRRRAP